MKPLRPSQITIGDTITWRMGEPLREYTGIVSVIATVRKHVVFGVVHVDATLAAYFEQITDWQPKAEQE